MASLPDIEHIHKFVTREWVYDRKIVVFSVENTSRDTADAWANGIKEILATWPKEKPYLAIYDVSKIMSLTPYARKRTEDVAVFASEQNLHGYTAIVLQNNILSTILKLFVQRDLTRKNAGFERRIFLKREEAIEWLTTISDSFANEI